MLPIAVPDPTPNAPPAPADTPDEVLVEQACVLHDRAVAAREASDFFAGEAWAREALDLMERGAGPDHPDIANVLLNLAGLCEDQGRYGEAETHYRRAAQLLTALPKDLGADVDRLYVQALTRLGHHLCSLARYEVAEAHLLAALERAETAFGPDALEVAGTLNALGVLGKFTGRFDAAEPRYLRALAILETAHGTDHLDVASLYHNLGGLEHARGRHADAGRVADAEAAYRRALRIFDATVPPDHPHRVICCENYAALRAISEDR